MSLVSNEKMNDADALTALNSELRQISENYSYCLKTDGIEKEIRTLLAWCDDYQQGGGDTATRNMRENALPLLISIKQKLHNAIEEKQRIDEESPSNAANSGDDATIQLNRAATAVAQAETNMQEVVNNLT